MVWDQELDPERERPYWPDFVKEDYQAVLGLVGRYALYIGVPEFTFGQLEGHLDRSNVRLTGEMDLPTLFAEMRSDIVRDLKKDGRRYEWRERHVGRRVLYGLVSLEPEAAGPPPGDEAVLPLEPVREEPLARLPVAERADEPEESDRRLDSLFERASDRRIRMKDLPELIMRSYRVDAAAAAKMIQTARTEQRLHKHAEGGISFLSLDPPVEKAGKARRVATHEDAERGARPLSASEVAAAERIMDALTAKGIDAAAGSTIKRMEHELGLSLSPADLRRLLRHMESMRLITIDNSGNYGQARKSPRVRVKNQEMKTRWVSDRDAYVANLRDSKMPG